MPEAFTQRWTFSQPSPLGDISSSVELTSQGLTFHSDAALDTGSHTVRWDAITQAATAVADMPGGKNGPDMPRWMPSRLEWLLIARTDGAALMRPLPDGDARDRLVAELRRRLGPRWVGEGLPLHAARRRLGLSSRGQTLKVALLVLAVLAILFGLLVLLALLASPVFMLPAASVVGGCCFQRGLAGLRDALQITNMPTARVTSAAMGLVELQGRAVTDAPCAAGASGRASVWWDVAVDAWESDAKGSDGGWRQLVARHGGRTDALVLQDATGRLPIWLRDADLLLQEHAWESGKDELPAAGRELLRAAGLAWDGARRLRVRERRMEAGGPLYVLGTLDEARHLDLASLDVRGFAGLARALRTGAWRSALVQRLPGVLRPPVMVTLAYLDMLFSLGRGGERASAPRDAAPPLGLDPAAVLVWKGRAGRPFIVSDQRETGALAQLRKRSLLLLAVGAGVMCWCLHELIQLF
ncbi:hypothetical protein [Azohydromonas australica]|uniref:hypothetical protein n=1 Tax=Azohydromonas australica TaxID=364039 RepID=UPI0003FFA99B|nr:hypothetical protein [Azohydromonas australica]